MFSLLKQKIGTWLGNHFTLFQQIKHLFVQVTQIDSQLQEIRLQLKQDVERQIAADLIVCDLQKQMSPFLRNDLTMNVAQLSQHMTEVEFYQPLYNLDATFFTDVIEPQRPCLDRAEAMFKACQNNVAGSRILDVGSSLGYFSFYFADRGALVTGIESHPKNVQVSESVKKINKLKPEFLLGTFDTEFVAQIPENRFEYALILSVLHHIVHFQGLDYTQKLLRTLMDKVPVLFIELARKDEELEIYWRPSLPENPLAVFDQCGELQIELLGEFTTHLSKVKRPLYKVMKVGTVKVHDRYYRPEKTFFRAYPTSPIGSSREYHLTTDAFIKKYYFDANTGLALSNREQIIREIANYIQVQQNKREFNNLPKMLDFVINANDGVVVLSRLSGERVSDCLEKMTEPDKIKVFRDLIQVVLDLRSVGLFHNDLRCWNILVNKGETFIFDLGFASGLETEETRMALLWIAAELNTGKILGYEYPRHNPPFSDPSEYGPTFNQVARYLLQQENIEWNSHNGDILSALL